MANEGQVGGLVHQARAHIERAKGFLSQAQALSVDNPERTATIAGLLEKTEAVAVDARVLHEAERAAATEARDTLVEEKRAAARIQDEKRDEKRAKKGKKP